MQQKTAKRARVDRTYNYSASTPFERITYTQCVEELKREGEEIEFGDDLLDSHLRIIGKNHPRILLFD